MSLSLPDLYLQSATPTALPYPTAILRKRPWYSFVRTNGYMSLAQRLLIKVYSSTKIAETLWNKFSPKESLFDLWSFRKPFFESFKTEPYFLTLFEEKEDEDSVLGVLPLWIDDDEFKGKYSWCGGYWPENNSFFVKDEEVIPLLLMAAPKPLYLSCIKPLAEYEFLKTLPGFSYEEELKFYLPISQYANVDDYLQRLKKKKRHNIRRDRKRILSYRPRIILNDPRHIEDLFRLNIDRFTVGTNGDRRSDSIYQDKRQQELFRKLIGNSSEYETRIIATELNGKIEAVEVGFIYNKVFYSVSSGANITDYSGLGVYSNLLVIEDAMKNKCTQIDFLEGDYNWKSSWDLEGYHECKFEK
jgi:hypothetical protein